MNEVGYGTIIDWRMFRPEDFGLHSDAAYPLPQDGVVTDDINLFAYELLISCHGLNIVFVTNALKECWIYFLTEYGEPLEYYKKLDDWKNLGAIFNSGKYLLLCYDGAENFDLSKYIVIKR